jgi:hypothetical protein
MNGLAEWFGIHAQVVIAAHARECRNRMNQRFSEACSPDAAIAESGSLRGALPGFRVAASGLPMPGRRREARSRIMPMNLCKEPCG